MKKTMCLLLCCLCSGGAAVLAQTRLYCTVYQYAGNDSAARTVALRQVFDAGGRLVSESYSGYKRSNAEGLEDGTYRYEYRDTLLVTRRFGSPQGDSIRTVFYYDKENQLVREETFSFKKRLRKGVDKGMGRPGGCVVFESDFEKRRRWSKDETWRYSYDSAGCWGANADSSQLLHRKHDALGRLVLEESLHADGRPVTITDRCYSDTVCLETWTYFGYGSQPQADGEEQLVRHATRCRLNAAGQVVEETMEMDGTTAYRETTGRDAVGRVLRTVYYSSGGQPEISHVFVYRKR